MFIGYVQKLDWVVLLVSYPLTNFISLSILLFVFGLHMTCDMQHFTFDT